MLLCLQCSCPRPAPPAAAPFLMSSVQFFFQHLIARAVLLTGMVKRKSDGSLSWRDYLRKGAWGQWRRARSGGVLPTYWL